MRLVFVILALLLTSCATTVTTIKKDQDRVLNNNSGYLLLGIETNRNLKTIRISGPQTIELSSADIKKGNNYLFIDLEAGQYTIDKIRLDKYWFVELDDEEYWDFEVKPNQISYVGHMEIVRHWFWGGATNAELVNRSSEALEFLEDKYPNILTTRSVTYGGPGEDAFFEFLKSEFKE